MFSLPIQLAVDELVDANHVTTAVSTIQHPSTGVYETCVFVGNDDGTIVHRGFDKVVALTQHLAQVRELQAKYDRFRT